MPTSWPIALGLIVVSLSRSASGIAWVEPHDELPKWASVNILQLTLSADSTNYAIIPLTGEVALPPGQSEGYLDISGELILVRETNYDKFNDTDDVAYFSCDLPLGERYENTTDMLNTLMDQEPRAIVLYSTTKNRCFLDCDEDLAYANFLTMIDAGEAAAVLSHLNDTDRGDNVSVSIFGNTTQVNWWYREEKPYLGDPISIMYVIFALAGSFMIFFLLSVFCGWSCYVPPSVTRDSQGHLRQNKAKGLARAVLETIPIVKFGNQQPPKPNPAMEMETAINHGRYPAGQRTVANGGATQPKRNAAASTTVSVRGTYSRPSEAARSLECSICTEEFKVGQDVRVLPCKHQYHPACIDPWLVCISGTCPLCRMDLRPESRWKNNNTSTSAGGGTSLPPPLASELGPNEAVRNPPGTRLTGVGDVNQLRQASQEEQMAALRRIRQETANREGQSTDASASNPSDAEDRRQRACLADKLKEKFRILTRRQSAEQPIERPAQQS